MQRLAHSSSVLRVGIHPEQLRYTSLHVQITPKKKSKNNVVNLLSQMKSPDRFLESQAEKEEPALVFWESFVSANIWEVCFCYNSF